MPLQTDWVYTTDGYGAEFNRRAEVVQAMWEADGDFKFSVKTPAYRTEWRNNYNRGYGRYVGASYGQSGPRASVGAWIFDRLSPDLDGTGNVLLGDNAPLVKFIDDQRREFDPERRLQIIHELQRWSAKKMFWMMDAGEALGYTPAWPWLGNFRAFHAATGGAEGSRDRYSRLG
jgi:ABC-type transport system substrate-binding protein